MAQRLFQTAKKKGRRRAPPTVNLYNAPGLAARSRVSCSIAGLPNGSHRSDAMTDIPIYYHGTKADLKAGDLIEPGYASNYGRRKQANFVYLSATLDAAIWGAELAVGAGRGRIYIVEPTGPIEDDPNLTDKRFPGNPTRSYRSRDAFRVVGKVTEWQGHTPERLKEMHDHLEDLKRRGIEAIEE